MADYEHDIFISYRRSDEDWIRWTRENLVRALASLLRLRLGRLRIYMDESLETGASWPKHLALNLSRSQLMVAVLSRDYFYSDWCSLELALMTHRERLTNLRTRENPNGLIIPLVIDDGDSFPAEVREMQCESLHNFANPFIRPDSQAQEALAEKLRNRVCPTIEHALRNIPPFDQTWEEIAQRHFEHTFRLHMQTQMTVPSFSLPQING